MESVKFTRSKGFTLIELMVVIAIIAILAVVGATLFNNAQKNARDGRRRADIQAISSALENHFNTANNQNCTDPTSGSGHPITYSSGQYCPPSPTWFAGGSIPKDPVTGTDYEWKFGAAAFITNLATATLESGAAGYSTYEICAALENNTQGNSDTSGNAAVNGAWYCSRNQQQ